MKKIIYIAAFVIVTGILSSCTEENIEPQSTATQTEKSGGW